MDYSAILEKMMEIARGAGEVQLKHFRSGHLDPHSKLNNFDVVTIADRESEDYILSSIRNLYPAIQLFLRKAVLTEASTMNGAGWLTLSTVPPTTIRVCRYFQCQ